MKSYGGRLASIVLVLVVVCIGPLALGERDPLRLVGYPAVAVVTLGVVAFVFWGLSRDASIRRRALTAAGRNWVADARIAQSDLEVLGVTLDQDSEPRSYAVTVEDRAFSIWRSADDLVATVPGSDSIEDPGFEDQHQGAGLIIVTTDAGSISLQLIGALGGAIGVSRNHTIAVAAALGHPVSLR